MAASSSATVTAGGAGGRLGAAVVGSGVVVAGSLVDSSGVVLAGSLVDSSGVVVAGALVDSSGLDVAGVDVVAGADVEVDSVGGVLDVLVGGWDVDVVLGWLVVVRVVVLG